MTKWILSVATTTLLLAGTAVAHPIWVKRADQTEIRGGRITEVDHARGQVVIEDLDRITIPASAQVAMIDVQPGATVDARFTEIGDENTILSLRVLAHDEQAP